MSIPAKQYMVKYSIYLFLICTAIASPNAQDPIAQGPYLGQTPPGSTPEIFAPGLICESGKEQRESNGSFSSDGKTFCCLKASGVYMTQETEAGWMPLERIQSIPGDSSKAWAPYVSPDGKAIFFSNEDLNVTRKTENGWSWPQRIPEPVNSASEEFGFGLAADNTLYFCSHRPGGQGGCDLWVAPCADGTWPKVTNIGDTINTAHNDCGAAIAPDQSFMVFWSNRPGGYGTYDLYVSLRQPDGNWSKPQNLGKKINTRAYEMAASISPDGKYLFFTRYGREADIYWVDLQAVLSNLSDTTQPVSGN